MEQLNFFEIIDNPTSVCPVCEKIFEKKILKAKYCSGRCSSKCSSKIFYHKNKEKIKQKYFDDREKHIKRKRLFYAKNKEKINEKSRQYRLENKEKIKNIRKRYYDKNKEKIKETKKQYCIENNEKMRKVFKKYHKKHSNNMSYRIKNALRARIRKTLFSKKTIKSENTLELLGCSVEHVKKYLESQFKEGMAWDNYGSYGWHIDHIIPCASFDLTDPEQQKKCFNYKNLQPLWWNENLSKGAKILLEEGV
jgi:hypothetical protein